MNSIKEVQKSKPISILSFDNIGIGVSGICLVHCLLAPVALVTLSFLPLGGIPLLETLHHWIHPALALIIVPVTFLAMWSGFQRFAGQQHRRLLVLLPLSLGLVIVLTVSLFIHEKLHPLTEAGFNLLGGGLLIIGHWWNKQACK